MNVKDGLAAIVMEVLGDVQSEAEKIILESESEAKKILHLAKLQADETYSSLVSKAKEKAETEERRIASLTEVEIRNLLLKSKEDLVDEAFKKASVSLNNFTKSPDYKEYMLRLIETTSKKVGSKKLILIVNNKDKIWLKKEKVKVISDKLGISLKLSAQSFDFVGGCKIQTEDGKITCDGTIDSKLEEHKIALRTQVAKILFEKET